VGSVPSLFQRLTDGSLTEFLVAVATRVVGPVRPGDLESWDLTLHGEGFEVLTCDPFSFAGAFVFQGLDALRIGLLGPAGFIFPVCWPGNRDGSEFHVPVQWIAPISPGQE